MTTRATTRIAVATFLGALAVASDAHAQSTIKNPNPPRYSVEIEPKLNVGPSDVWGYGGGSGFGPGVRFSIPVMSPGFVKSINDSVAISFGLDLIHYSGYAYYYNGCNRFGCATYDAGDFWSAYFPVAMQWNFWLTDRWSVFGEPGLVFRHAFYNDAYCNPNVYYGCGHRDDVLPLFDFGGRFMLSEKVGLTMRLGYPVFFSIGLSIFP